MELKNALKLLVTHYKCRSSTSQDNNRVVFSKCTQTEHQDLWSGCLWEKWRNAFQIRTDAAIFQLLTTASWLLPLTKGAPSKYTYNLIYESLVLSNPIIPHVASHQFLQKKFIILYIILSDYRTHETGSKTSQRKVCNQMYWRWPALALKNWKQDYSTTQNVSAQHLILLVS